MNGFPTAATRTCDDRQALVRDSSALAGQSQLTDRDFDLVVADASWTWTERLFSPLAERGVRVLLLKACDWRTALNLRLPPRDWTWPRTHIGPNLWEQRVVLPPGWMKTYPSVGMRPIAWAVNSWRRAGEPRRRLALAISYPHYIALRPMLKPDHLVYYNMDDYTLYWKSRRRSVRRLEAAAVEACDAAFFCARARADELTDRVPNARPRIVHLPHGAPAEAIPGVPVHRPAAAPADMAHLPRPYLGFVGSIEDRIDWPLIEQLSASMPAASIILVGRPPRAVRGAWYQAYRRAVARPNVHLLGWRPQSRIHEYVAAFDVCLIPYDTKHVFNQNASPTKLMDYMASTRPVVTTALPESRLYHAQFDVADSAEAFVGAVASIVARGSDDGRAGVRWHAARTATWRHRADELWDHFRRRIT